LYDEKYAKNNNHINAESSSSSRSSSRSKSPEKTKKTKHAGDNGDNVQQPNREPTTISIQKNNANHYDSKYKVCEEQAAAVLLSREEAVTTATSLSSSPLLFAGREASRIPDVKNNAVDNGMDDADISRNDGNNDELEPDDDSSSTSSSSSSSSLSSCSSVSGVSSGWACIEDEGEEEDSYEDDCADDGSALEQVVKEGQDRSVEKSPLKNCRGWSSDSDLIFSMRTCPSWLDDDDDNPLLTSPLSWLRTTTTSTPTRARLTAPATTTSTGSMSPLTMITAGMTDSPSSPPGTPSVSAPFAHNEKPTIRSSSKSKACGKGKTRPCQSKTLRRSTSLPIKETAAPISLSTTLPIKKKTSTPLASSPAGRKKSCNSSKRMKHALNPRTPVLSKYIKTRLGIQRSMDLSGQLIETYAAPFVSSSAMRKDGLLQQQQQDAFKAAVVLETILAAATVAEYMQGWKPMVYWSQRLFQELHGSRRTCSSSIMTASKWFVNQIGFMEMRALPVAIKLEAMGFFSCFNKSFFSEIVKDCRDKWLLDGENVTAKMFATIQRQESHDRGEQQQQQQRALSPTNNSPWIGPTSTTSSPPVKLRDLTLPCDSLKAKWCDMERILTEINRSPRVNRNTVMMDQPGNAPAMVLAKTRAELVEAQNLASKFHQQLLLEQSRSAVTQESYDEEITRILFAHEEVCGKLREELERSQHQLHVLQLQHHSSVPVDLCHPSSLEHRINGKDSNANKATIQLEHRVQELQGQLGRLGTQLETAESKVKLLEEELAAARKSQQGAHHTDGTGIAKSLDAAAKENDATNDSLSRNDAYLLEKKLAGFLRSRENDSSKPINDVTRKAAMHRSNVPVVSILVSIVVFACFSSIAILIWMEATAPDHTELIVASETLNMAKAMPLWLKFATEKMPGWVKGKVAAALG
jgi:hypothetical protein